MDSCTGKIYEGLKEALDDGALMKNLIPITKREVKFLSKRDMFQRKNHMRNKPCPCGSGKKFKKCCWARGAE
jgi:uncharacterized protein YecA (UPF0149 family)